LGALGGGEGTGPGVHVPVIPPLPVVGYPTPPYGAHSLLQPPNPHASMLQVLISMVDCMLGEGGLGAVGGVVYGYRG
jgi:hypothetical protein